MAKLKTHWGYRSRAICGMANPPYYTTNESRVTCRKCKEALRANEKRTKKRYGV